jgi:hypothetical protein
MRDSSDQYRRPKRGAYVPGKESIFAKYVLLALAGFAFRRFLMIMSLLRLSNLRTQRFGGDEHALTDPR